MRKWFKGVAEDVMDALMDDPRSESMLAESRRGMGRADTRQGACLEVNRGPACVGYSTITASRLREG